MKTTIMTGMILGMLLANTANVEASSKAKDIVKAGAIITGIAGLAILAEAANSVCDPVYVNHHNYYTPYSSYSNQIWVPGHYETRYEQVWIPGQNRTVWIEPVFEWREHCGKQIKVLVREGYYKEVCDTGFYETRETSFWVEGYWQTNYNINYSTSYNYGHNSSHHSGRSHHRH